ncbi:hypothetical protein NM688_g8540 [Phlebia brevispora]|uniref:Uncharacterized protein n=1 Tax=Phlebia brevispora TaxID=194682 RepID=A0ACC1RQA4_9APHY|nr:hypothetical protein NM688_g8540 [Phlebia brevispora]
MIAKASQAIAVVATAFHAASTAAKSDARSLDAQGSKSGRVFPDALVASLLLALEIGLESGPNHNMGKVSQREPISVETPNIRICIYGSNVQGSADFHVAETHTSTSKPLLLDKSKRRTLDFRLLQQESFKHDWRAQGWDDEENFPSLADTRTVQPYCCNSRDPAKALLHTSTAFLCFPDNTMSNRLIQHRVGGWLPQDQSVLERWLSKKIARAEARADEPFHPVIQEFQRFIEGDPVIYMGFHQMFEQVPDKLPYKNNPTRVRDYKLMLALFNDIITTAPAFEENDLVGFPINAILDWPMVQADVLRLVYLPYLSGVPLRPHHRS